MRTRRARSRAVSAGHLSDTISAVAAALALGAIAGGSASIGCGPAVVRDEDIFHEASLRPGAVPAQTDAEHQLLDRLGALEEGSSLRIGDRAFVVVTRYASASGRACARVQEHGSAGVRVRVACQDEGAGWSFVPDVFGGADPFSQGFEQPARPEAAEGSP